MLKCIADRIPLIATLAASAAILLLPNAARSQATCVGWEVLKTTLAEKHHEHELGGGIVSPQAVMVVFVSPGGDTWTLAALGTNGQACIVAEGVDWFQRSIPHPDETPS